jgi:hypothetical protein
MTNLTANITVLGCAHGYHPGWIGLGRRRCPVCNTETIPTTLATINVYSGTILVTTAARGTCHPCRANNRS